MIGSVFKILARYFVNSGTRMNRIGYKTFSINLIRDEEVRNSLIHKVNEIIKT